MLTNEEVGKVIISNSLGEAVDTIIKSQRIGDEKLSRLWTNAEVALNEIQLYLEEKLGVNFFNV